MAIDVYEAGDEIPSGARALGIRVKPIIRLGMGVKDPERGFPVKTDYLTVRGDDRAVAKFYATYGEKPKAVEILLPSELDVALTIQYRAFKGAAGGEGGTLVAVGATNFALRDYCGGADLLTVFNQDGTVSEVETAGLDANTREPLDEIARDTGIELYTTLRAGMPNVLGFGSHFEISTKGKQSTDALWAKLRELYALFGSRITFAVKPQLVLRPSTARPVVVDKETKKPKRTTTTIYALDIVVPETIDEMIGRLQTRQAALAPAGAVAALYGSAASPSLPAETPAGGADAGSGQQVGAAGTPGGTAPLETSAASAPGDHVEDAEWEEAIEGLTVEEAAATKVPGGTHGEHGRTLADVAALGDSGLSWLTTQLRRLAADDRLRPAIEIYVRDQLPETWAKYQAWLAEQSS